ncbi:MAG: hypothetical protein A3J62_03240 [Candidatus Buchananbacteria bacterium RIFCSPHIGHO2_02_FULL_38_8]|uniref:Uncharacterized protein n=1 Tax=Candidatus Buchananbacteria bacterium RIFCSPHIGHO2_02_FULL_38_8 TaxID=1797538 RepID=A0A1G1Y4D5_9BACT|nr:MAG: hypothetical protein A3J62_03240 [Candidatus Buchananbacteria bacterium RIFCSPHIGHO2_02_FULL_38_8]
MKFKKQSFIILISTVILLLNFPALLLASPFSFGGSDNVPGMFGQQHQYSVLFRGNGEAVVGGKIIINNGDEKNPIEFLNLEPVSLKLNEIEVFQEFCQNKILQERAEKEQCDNYCYYGGNCGNFERVFEKLNFEIKDSQYKIKLFEAVQPYQTGVVLVSYRGFGYVQDGLFGRKKFDFQTLRTDDKVNSIKVSVTVDTDLYFEGKKSTIDYSTQGVDVGLEYGAYTGLGARSSALSMFSSEVGGYGQINKTANQLLPGETFHVKGIYSSTWFGLNYIKLSIFVGILLIIIVSAIIISRIIYKRRKDKPVVTKLQNLGSVKEKPKLPVWLAIVYGICGAIGIPAVITLIFWFFNFVMETFVYNNYSSYNPLALVLVWIISLLIFVVIIFALPVYCGIRYRGRDGIYVFLWQILFLIFISVILSLTNLGAGFFNL